MAIVQELMTPEPVKVAADTPVDRCARIAWRLGIRHLPVVDDHGRLAGVVSDFDLLQHGEIVGEDGTWADRGSGTATAGDLARTLAVECRADDDLLGVLTELRDTQRDVAVVVDLRRHPIGILTEHDAVRWARAFLGDAPTLVPPDAPVHAVDITDPGFAAFDRMVDTGVRHLLAFDGDTLVGVVSWRDLVVEDLLDWRRVHVGDLLRSDPPVTLPVGASMLEVAETMVRRRVGCIPLVDEAGAVQAVVSRSDVIAAVLGRVPADTGGR